MFIIGSFSFDLSEKVVCPVMVNNNKLFVLAFALTDPVKSEE